MLLKSSKLIPILTFIYSGYCLYASNSKNQASCEKGGNIPEIGCQLTIDKPDPVNLVAPPTIIITNTKKATQRSQIPIALSFFDLEKIDDDT